MGFLRVNFYTNHINMSLEFIQKPSLKGSSLTKFKSYIRSVKKNNYIYQSEKLYDIIKYHLSSHYFRICHLTRN